MNSLIGWSPDALRKAAGLKEQIEALQQQLAELFAASGPTQAQKPATVRTQSHVKQEGRPGKGMTINVAIIEALEGGASDVQSITAKVLALKGKASKAAIYQALVALKKSGQIASPARGQYAVGK